MFGRHFLGLMFAVISSAAAAMELPFPQPLPGVYSTGQPTQEQVQQAADTGISTVIDLRQHDEDRGYDEATAVTQAGLRYVSLPIAGASDITAENARALARLLDEARAQGPVLVHCSSGNRVGALLSLIHAQLEGGSAEAAIELGRAAGMTSLEAAARAALAAPPHE